MKKMKARTLFEHSYIRTSTYISILYQLNNIYILINLYIYIDFLTFLSCFLLFEFGLLQATGPRQRVASMSGRLKNATKSCCALRTSGFDCTNSWKAQIASLNSATTLHRERMGLSWRRVHCTHSQTGFSFSFSFFLLSFSILSCLCVLLSSLIPHNFLICICII